MTYIKTEKRKELAVAGLGSVATTLETTDDLTYAISFMANEMVRENGYCGISAIRGALIDAADEFYRRVMAPYEDFKLAENGDVYDRRKLICHDCGFEVGFFPTGVRVQCPECLSYEVGTESIILKGGK